MAAERLCLRCQKEIPKWRSKNEKFCTGVCRLKFREEQRHTKAAERVFENKSYGLIRVHSCLSNPLDPYKPCRCRKTITEEEAKDLVARGAAIDFNTRTAIVTSGPVLLVGIAKQTPRVQTLEKAHIQRAYEFADLKGILKNKTREELVALAENAKEKDKAARVAEERARIEMYGELIKAVRKEITVELSVEKYAEMVKNDPWIGRAIIARFEDERTEGGIGVTIPMNSLPTNSASIVRKPRVGDVVFVFDERGVVQSIRDDDQRLTVKMDSGCFWSGLDPASLRFELPKHYMEAA